MSKLLIKHPTVSVEWLFNHLNADNLVILDGSIKKVVNPSLDASEVQIPNTRFFDLKDAFSDVSAPFPTTFPSETQFTKEAQKLGINADSAIVVYDDKGIYSSARFFDLKDAFSDVSAPFPTTFPSETQFTKEAQKLGINADSAIVVYDDKGIYSSARVWWLFKAMGHENVAVLDGGLPEWITSGYKTEIKIDKPIEKGNFVSRYQPELMKFFDDVKEASENKSHLIVDARSEARFKSLEAEPRAGLRMGNIPNSVNLPYEDLLNGNKLISQQKIESKFKNLAKKDDVLIFSCGSGITACVLALGATMSGYNNISVYDGSWTEWGSLVKD